MITTVKTVEESRFSRTGTTGPLSESVIPTVPGKYYAYSSVFTNCRPLYALLDCKANKSRPLADAGKLGREVHLRFEFNSATLARVYSVKTAQVEGLLVPADVEFDDVWVAPAGIAIEDFYVLCAQRNSARLADICKAACRERETANGVVPGSIVAVMTSAGKYGLFLVTELTPTSVAVEACHVLLS